MSDLRSPTLRGPAGDAFSAGGGSGRPGRGRPRSEAADRAIVRAAIEVLARQGLGAMTIEKVAASAGVGKATIYRRWSSKGALALDAFLAEFTELFPVPDTGTLRGDLQTSLRAWARSITTTGAGRMLAGLIAETQRDPELAAGWRDLVVRPIRARYTRMLDRAKSRGEIPADTDTDVVLDLLFGAGLYRLLHGHGPLNDEFVDRALAIVMAGLGGPGALAGHRETAPAAPAVTSSNVCSTG